LNAEFFCAIALLELIVIKTLTLHEQDATGMQKLFTSAITRSSLINFECFLESR